MKRNLIAVAVAGALVVPFAVNAADAAGPNVTFKGDAELNYYNHNIKSSKMLAIPTDLKDDQWDSRVRLVVTGTDGKNAMAAARLRMQNDSHGDGTAGGNGSDLDFDYAYLQMNVQDLFTIKAGDWKRDWGHKLYVWDNSAEGVSIIKKMGDLSFGLHQLMNTEDSNGLGNPGGTDGDLNDDDKSTLIFSAEMTGMAGLRIDRITNDITNKNSTNFDIYGGAPLGGGWGLGFEFARRDKNETGLKDDKGNPKANWGLLIAAMGKAGPADVQAFYVMSKDGYNTDNNMFAFNFTGDENGPIMTGLGTGTGKPNGLTDKDSSGMGVIAGFAGLDAMPSVDLQFGLGLVTADKGAGLAAGQDSKITILHAKATKNLSKNSSINAQFGNFSGDFKATAFGLGAYTSF